MNPMLLKAAQHRKTEMTDQPIAESGKIRSVVVITRKMMKPGDAYSNLDVATPREYDIGCTGIATIISLVFSCLSVVMSCIAEARPMKPMEQTIPPNSA